MKKEILLKRFIRTDKVTISEIGIDGQFICYALELPWRDNKTSISCIPKGIYEVVFRKNSPTFHYPHLHVLGVPGRTWILVHKGNKTKDTRGCILPGLHHTKNNSVEDSSKALDLILQNLHGATKIILTIIDL